MTSGTVVFQCASCGYKARIPTQYAGHTIRCPGCQSPQVAMPAPAGPITGKTVSILKVASTPVPFTLPPDQAAALATASLTPLPSDQWAQGQAAHTPVLGNPSGLRPRIAPPLPEATPAGTPTVRPSTTASPDGKNIEFTCVDCHARMRIPSTYVGKSILCPKCSAPQKVAPPGQPEPMDTTRSISKTDLPVIATPPRVARPPSGEFNLQTAPIIKHAAPLEAVPTTKVESDSSLARAGVPRRRGVAGSDSGVSARPPDTTIPPPPAAEPAAEATPGPGPKVVRSGRIHAAEPVPSPALAPAPVAKPTASRGGLLVAGLLGLLLLAALGAAAYLQVQAGAAQTAADQRAKQQASQMAKLQSELATKEQRVTELEQTLASLSAEVDALKVAASAPAPVVAEPPAPVVAEPPATEPATTPAPDQTPVVPAAP